MDRMGASESEHVPKIFIVCDRADTAPAWQYVLQHHGLIAILESSAEKAVDHWSTEMPDLGAIDIDVARQDPLLLCKNLRTVSVAPLLLFLPTHHETQILEAYAAGVDDVLIKPVSPAIFLAKVLAWVRRSWVMPVAGLSLVKAGQSRLDPSRRCLVMPDGMEIKLTNLEFRLLHLLMSHPGQVCSAEDMIQAMWGGYGNGDQVLLKNVVYRLRRKIEVDPGHPVLLQTWQGGYSFAG